MSDLEFSDLIDNSNAIQQIPFEEFNFEKGDAHEEVLQGLLDLVIDGWRPTIPRVVLRNEETIRYDLVELDKVNVQMSPEAFAYCQDQVQWRKLAYMPTGPHDHPVSHYLTEVNEAKVVERFGKQRFIDLFGNPKRQMKHGRNSVTYYSNTTAKDVLRDFGSMDGTNEFRDVGDMTRRHPKVKHVLMTHSAYYLSADKLAEIVHYPGPLAKKRRVYAIVHRHPAQAGFLNMGELQYEYVDDTTVRQWSVQTGEGYEHPSMEPYFHANACHTQFGGLVWTHSRLAGDTYLLEFAADSRAVALPALPSLENTFTKPFTVTETECYKVRSLWGRTWVEYAGPEGPVTLHDTQLFDILRRHIAGRERSLSTKKDLMLLCRRLCDKRDIFAKYQAEHNIAPEMIMWYVEAAYHADIAKEVDLMISFRRAHHKTMDMHAKLMADPGYFDDTWLNTFANAAGVGDRVGAATIPVATAAVSTAVGIGSDVALSAAKYMSDLRSKGLHMPKYHPGITDAALQEIGDYMEAKASVIATECVSDEYVRSANVTVKLLGAITAPKKITAKYREPAPPLPAYAPRLPSRPPAK